MSFKRSFLGIGVGSVCALLSACGGGSSTPSPGNEGGSGGDAATAGSGTVAGSANGQAGSHASAGSSNGGNTSGGSSSQAGLGGTDASAAGEAGASEEGGSTGTAGSGAGGVGGTNSGGVGGASGSGGAGGTGGTGGAGPQATSTKLDVLFVVDNSVSMADKQDVLENTLPAFVNRVTNPLCVDANHQPVATQPTSITQPCASGTREFTANDVHIGVITTSLGAHGGSVCSAPSPNDGTAIVETLDDKGELVGKLRTGLTTWQNSGYLSWDPHGVTGSSNPADITANLKAMIVAAGDHGCGYEAPLEAMYRFLIDPEPPATVSKVNNATLRQGTDTELLSERAAFLRPDSAVAVLLLSDENDCSIEDDGVGWFVGATSHMPKATAACAANPNDACCRSCAQVETAPPTGCLAISADPVCMGAAAGSYNTWDTLNDSLNLRCFDQKQRFGFDLLYPISRYTAGLTSLTVQNDAGVAVKNPLFYNSSGVQTRSPSLVTAAVMVGVPWQDLATSASLSGGKLEYLDAAGLAAQGRYPILLGDPSTFVPPQDPFMLESIAPRTGTNPLTNAAIAPATSTNPTQNPINGHEQNIPQNDDLQYACTFKLPAPKVCANGDSACDCSATAAGDASGVVAANSPVCQPPAGGAAGTTQYYAKAYPGIRELSVIRSLNDRGVATSICPKTLDAGDSQFGYAPAFDALLKRVSADLQ